VLGSPGAGKSYETVRRFVTNACKNKRKIITNLPLKIEEIEKKFPEMKGLIELRQGKDQSNPYASAFDDVKDLKDDWKNDRGNRALIIIDEAHFCIGNHKHKDKLTPYEDFFSTHRQEGYDVILITQTAKRLSPRVLGMCETFYHCFNKSSIGLSRLYEVVITSDVRERLTKNTPREKFTYSPEIHNLYRSHALAENPIQEMKPNKPSVYQLLKMWWFIPVGLFLILFTIYYIFSRDVNLNPTNFAKDVNVEQNKKPEIKKEELNKNQNVNNQIDKPQAQAIPEKKEKKKSVKDLRPYHDFTIFIDGVYDENFQKIFILSFEKDGKKQFSVHSNELKLLNLIPISQYEDCIAILKWREETEYIYCKTEEKKEESEFLSTATEAIPSL
jgi:hypothetical protein